MERNVVEKNKGGMRDVVLCNKVSTILLYITHMIYLPFRKIM